MPSDHLGGLHTKNVDGAGVREFGPKVAAEGFSLYETAMDNKWRLGGGVGGCKLDCGCPRPTPRGRVRSGARASYEQSKHSRGGCRLWRLLADMGGPAAGSGSRAVVLGLRAKHYVLYCVPLRFWYIYYLLPPFPLCGLSDSVVTRLARQICRVRLRLQIKVASGEARPPHPQCDLGILS